MAQAVKDKMKSFKKNVQSINGQTSMDVALFAGFVAVAYTYCTQINETVDTLVPSEEKMAEMFTEMQR